jgi:hypothetical protein
LRKKALADYFGPLLPRHLNDCRLSVKPKFEAGTGQ